METASDAGMALAAELVNDEQVAEQVAATDLGGFLQINGNQNAETSVRGRLDTSESAKGEAADTVSELPDLLAGHAPRLQPIPAIAERYSSFDASNVETLMSGGFSRFLSKVNNARQELNLAFPTPEIHFEDLSYTVWLSRESPTAKSSIGGYFRSVFAPWRKLRTVKKVILHPMSGIIRPGSLTLILASPGSGKSTFLKALAGKLTSRNGRRAFKGKISFSGLAAEDITISKIVGLMDQLDNHFPTLTVRETVQFADRCLNGPPQRQPLKLREVARLRTDLILHILGLTNCADTCVGDALLRGVSGGERKRVTIGEMLVGSQSVFLCDEISTGLDSAATFDITKSLRDWSRTVGGSAVVALLQPPPEVVELFDDVLILSEGRLVFHGPRSEMLPYFSKLGFQCSEHTDPAEFAVDVASGLGGQFLKAQSKLSSEAEADSFEPPRLATQFEALFRGSSIYKATVAVIEQKRVGYHSMKIESELQSIAHLIMKNSGAPLYKAGFVETTALVLARQTKIWMRDRALLLGKLVEATLVGFLLGIIYYIAPNALYLRMLFFMIAIFQRQAWQQITIVFQVRNIFYKQRSRNFFRTLAYTIAESLVQVPLNVAVSLTMSVIFYFMSGLARDGGTFIVYYIIIVCFQHAIAAYFTLLAAVSPTMTVGQAMASLSVSFFLLFSGNIILPKLIPSYWIWMYWFNPVAWALRAVLLNEFHDASYSGAERDAELARFQITQGKDFIWIGILVLIAYYVGFTLLNTAVLRFIHYEFQSTASSSAKAVEGTYSAEDKARGDNSARELSVVTPVPTAEMATATATASKDVVVQVPTAAQLEEGQSATFVSAYLAVKNLSYFVPNPAREGELQLLHGVNAFFVPGKMTALMGSSGAGKTTFMDVLAGRKTGGRIEGDILVNGEPKDPLTFSRIAGYCEQMDIHSGGATIREALEFSARLRLPRETTAHARAEIIQSAMDLLELNGIAADLVRNCSVEQKKRITIGVEVVANPSLLFLDEPTSGLDARSASIVMRGVLSIARTGRTVVCTIHQPSKQIFELFDSLLLLQKGGHMAFFGDLGGSSEKLLQYFAGIPGTAPMPPKYNPATYMLEVIGAGIGRAESRDYSLEYAKSALCKRNVELAAAIGGGSYVANTDEVEDATAPAPVTMTPFSSLRLTPIATGFLVQLRCCGVKMIRTYWRNPQYNLIRMVAFPVYALIFGSTFYKLAEGTSAAVNSHVALMYNTLDFIGVINLMTVLDIVSSERAVFYRERMANYYSALPYSLSLLAAELPYLLLTSLLFMSVEYWMIGWDGSARNFFLFWLVFLAHIATCTSIGQFMVVLMPNVKVASVAVGALSVFFNLFSGFLMPHAQMKAFYAWIRYLVVTNYSLEALVAIEMGQCDPLHSMSGGAMNHQHGCTMVSIPKLNTSPERQVVLRTFISDNYDFEYANVGRNIGVLVGILALLQVLIFLTLRFVSHLKR